MAVVGSSLLSLLDRLAFEVLPETGNTSSGNISKLNYHSPMHSLHIDVSQAHSQPLSHA